MASGSPETCSWTAPQKHSPEYVAITVTSLSFGQYVIRFARDKPELHTGSVQLALLR
jgi:hypothetical protein